MTAYQKIFESDQKLFYLSLEDSDTAAWDFAVNVLPTPVATENSLQFI